MEEVIIAFVRADGPGRALGVIEPEFENDAKITIGLVFGQTELVAIDFECIVLLLADDLPRRRRVPKREVIEEVGEATVSGYRIELDRERAGTGRERLAL